MKPSNSHSVCCVNLNDDYYGFYIINGSELDLDGLFNVNQTYTVASDAIRDLVQYRTRFVNMGYECGPIETKTRDEWAEEVFGVTSNGTTNVEF